MSSYADYLLKLDLIQDAITLVDIEHELSGREKTIGGFDLICKGFPTFGNISRLGTFCEKKTRNKRKKFFG